MSVNIYDSTTDTLHKVAGLVDDTDLKQDIEDIQAVIPSGASSTDKLVTESSKYKIETKSWGLAGNRYMKLSNMFISTSGLMTATYLITCRNGETYVMMCGNSDDSTKTTPQVIKLRTGTGKLDSNGFYWDANTAEIALMTQGYNIVQVTQIAGERTDFTIGDLTTSNPLTTPTALTVTSLEPTSTVTSGSSAPITSGGVAGSCPYVVFNDYSNEGNVKTYALVNGHYECKVYYYGGLCGIYDMVRNQFGDNGGFIATVWDNSVFKNYTISVEQSTGVVSMSGTSADNVEFVITKLP